MYVNLREGKFRAPWKKHLRRRYTVYNFYPLELMSMFNTRVSIQACRRKLWIKINRYVKVVVVVFCFLIFFNDRMKLRV